MSHNSHIANFPCCYKEVIAFILHMGIGLNQLIHNYFSSKNVDTQRKNIIHGLEKHLQIN